MRHIELSGLFRRPGVDGDDPLVRRDEPDAAEIEALRDVDARCELDEPRRAEAESILRRDGGHRRGRVTYKRAVSLCNPLSRRTERNASDPCTWKPP